MHILIGLALAVALLYFWLIGHWFARVLAFLVFAVCLGAAAGAGLAAANPADGAFVGILGLIFGTVAAWFVSGIPIYYWRRGDGPNEGFPGTYTAPPPVGNTAPSPGGYTVSPERRAWFREGIRLLRQSD
jgi:hypothetical protein